MAGCLQRSPHCKKQTQRVKTWGIWRAWDCCGSRWCRGNTQPPAPSALPQCHSVSPKGPAAHSSARHGEHLSARHTERTHIPLAGGHAHPCSRVAVLLAAPGVLRARRPSPGSGEAAAERTHGSASAIRLCAAPLIATQLAALQHMPRGDPECQQEGFPPSTAPVATSKPPNLSWFGAPRHRGGYRMAQGTAGQTCRAWTHLLCVPARCR